MNVTSTGINFADQFIFTRYCDFNEQPCARKHVRYISSSHELVITAKLAPFPSTRDFLFALQAPPRQDLEVVRETCTFGHRVQSPPDFRVIAAFGAACALEETIPSSKRRSRKREKDEGEERKRKQRGRTVKIAREHTCGLGTFARRPSVIITCPAEPIDPTRILSVSYFCYFSF